MHKLLVLLQCQLIILLIWNPVGCRMKDPNDGFNKVYGAQKVGDTGYIANIKAPELDPIGRNVDLQLT